LIVGTPLQAYAKLPASAESAYASTIRSGCGASVVASLQKLKIDNRWMPDSIAQVQGQTEVILYENTNLVPSNQILIVTRLPRAALSDLPAKSLAAS
jgi:hypothetical protein